MPMKVNQVRQRSVISSDQANIQPNPLRVMTAITTTRIMATSRTIQKPSMVLSIFSKKPRTGPLFSGTVTLLLLMVDKG